MSLLPTMGSLMATQDTNKQLSSIRSYLSQLQESMEAELMNIGIDNLSGELKKKLETMSDDIMVQSNEVQDLQTSLVTAEQVSAIVGSFNFVTTAYLQANYITANAIASNYVSTNYLTSNYVTANYIASNYVTANYLSTNYLTANAIATNYLKTSNFTASNIVAKFTASESAIFDRLNCRDFRVVTSNNNVYPLTWHSVNSGGNTIYFLGTNTAPT